MKDHIRAFLAFLRLNRNASEHTVRAYQGDLDQFTAYLAGQHGKKRPDLQPSDVTRPMIRAEISTKTALPRVGTWPSNGVMNRLFSMLRRSGR